MTTYDDRDLADEDLAAALGDLARSMTGTVDVERALDQTLLRARTRRRRRLVVPAFAAAAASVVALVAMTTMTGDARPSVRTPAVAPLASAPEPVPATTAPAPRAAPAVPATTAPVSAAAPAVSATTATDAVIDAPAAPVTGPAPTPPSYGSGGGSISVRFDGAAVALDGAPRPAPGWSVRIDDDGPSRVRVRFERDGRRSEIRVDVVDGRLEPRITDE